MRIRLHVQGSEATAAGAGGHGPPLHPCAAAAQALLPQEPAPEENEDCCCHDNSRGPTDPRTG